MALVRPLFTLVFACWIFWSTISFTLAYFGVWNVMLVIGCWFGVHVCLAFWHLQYAHLPDFEGFEIQVREPKVTFGGMQFNFDKYNLGDSVFVMMFFLQLSSLLVPFETSIHMCMGRDEDRAEDGTDTSACEGMMKQETNHGQCQLLYSKAAEDKLNYPSGWRQFWKFIILTVFPLPFRQAFVAWLEAGFIAMTSLLAAKPSFYDRLFCEPKWVFAWHLSEEAEHCWDSVPDMMHRVSVGWRVVIWAATWVLLPLQMGPLALLEGIAYGRHALCKSPSTFLWSFGTWLIFLPNFFLFAEACTMLHVLFAFRPSDEAYKWTRKQLHSQLFAPFKSQFKVTHFQTPEQHLKVRSTSIKSCGNKVVAAMRMDNQNKPDADAAAAVGVVRRSVYQETIQSLKTGGMTMEEIRHAGFGFASNPELVK